MDYLDWRGDLTFDAVPLCEVDNLIFSKLTFMDLENILPERGSGLTMSIGEAERLHAQSNEGKRVYLGLLVPEEIQDMFRRLARCDRFRHLLLSDYVNTIDLERQEQFSAVTVFLSPDELYIAFRGTDDTLVGWKENFNMSHMEAVPAQRAAVDYVDEVLSRCRHKRVYIGGHSKGGNLAIYAAVHCAPEHRERIVRVYNNDGPGFRAEMVQSAAYRAMEDRIITIIPQGSVVGRLLEHQSRYRAVKSTATGLWQHNGFSWEVLGDSFVDAEELTQESRLIEQSVKTWIAEMSEQEREQFVDALYRVLTATNATTLTELTADRGWLWKLMRDGDPEARKTVFGGLAQLTGEAGRLWAETIMPALRGKLPGTSRAAKDAADKKDE
jgi:hypothetical protein